MQLDLQEDQGDHLRREELRVQRRGKRVHGGSRLGRTVRRFLFGRDGVRDLPSPDRGLIYSPAKASTRSGISSGATVPVKRTVRSPIPTSGAGMGVEVRVDSSRRADRSLVGSLPVRQRYTLAANL